MGDAVSRTLRVALIADRELQGKHLKELLETHGMNVIIDQPIADYRPELYDADEVDVLLVNLDESIGYDMERLDALIEYSSVPILFNEGGIPGGKSWGRKLIAKLTGLVQGRNIATQSTVAATRVRKLSENAEDELPGGLGDTQSSAQVVASQYEPTAPARSVWILGASLGGPQALKQFLSHLPDTLPTGFIIAQHIGKPFVSLLAEQLGRVTRMRVMPAEHGRAVRTREVILVPIDSRFCLTEAGIVELRDEPVRGPYRPCIDEVMEEAARCYKQHSAAIVFSGMGNDGSLGAVAVERAGGMVWAQEAESCVMSSMPDAARQRGVVSFSGTPQELATQLAQRMGAEMATS